MMAQITRRPAEVALTGLISLVAGLFELSFAPASVEGLVELGNPRGEEVPQLPTGF